MTDSQRFHDTHVFRARHFSLGIDRKTEQPYLSTPVHGSTHAVEYEAYFSISDEEYRRFLADPEAGAALVEDCAMGRQDGRRIA